MSNNVLAYDSSNPRVKIECKNRKEKVSHEIKIESVGKSEKVHNTLRMVDKPTMWKLNIFLVKFISL